MTAPSHRDSRRVPPWPRRGGSQPTGAPADGSRTGGRRRRWLSIAAGVGAVALVLAVAVQAFLARVVVVPSDAMRPALEAGDRLLIDRLTLDRRAPARGEVVLVRRSGEPEPLGPGQALRSVAQGLGVVSLDPDVARIRRVVGLPGEIVAVRDGVLHVDGEALAEPYARRGGTDVGPVTVPAGHYWLVGDNRTAASTGLAVGPVPRTALLGRAMVVLWPPTRLLDRLHGTPRPAVRADRGLPGESALDMLARRARGACSLCARVRASRRHHFAATPGPPDRAAPVQARSGGPP